MRSRRGRLIAGTTRQSLNSRTGDAATSATSAPTKGRASGGTRMLESTYCTITWDGQHSIARFVRTDRPYASIGAIDEEGNNIQRALEKAGRIRLLVDLRAAPPRNDPSFEVAIESFRQKLLGGGQRIAVLVRTAIGALQVKRHMREDGFSIEVFTEEEQAIAFLSQANTSSIRQARVAMPASTFPNRSSHYRTSSGLRI